MAFQLRIVSLRARLGSIARHTWFRTNRKSRHALCVRCSVQVVLPRGNGAGVADRFLDQQCCEQLPVRPRPGAFVVVFRQMAQFGEGLETLEDKLDFPALVIERGEFGRRCVGGIEQGCRAGETLLDAGADPKLLSGLPIPGLGNPLPVDRVSNCETGAQIQQLVLIPARILARNLYAPSTPSHAFKSRQTAPSGPSDYHSRISDSPNPENTKQTQETIPM